MPGKLSRVLNEFLPAGDQSDYQHSSDRLTGVMLKQHERQYPERCRRESIPAHLQYSISSSSVMKARQHNINAQTHTQQEHIRLKMDLNWGALIYLFLPELWLLIYFPIFMRGVCDGGNSVIVESWSYCQPAVALNGPFAHHLCINSESWIFHGVLSIFYCADLLKTETNTFVSCQFRTLRTFFLIFYNIYLPSVCTPWMYRSLLCNHWVQFLAKIHKVSL